MWVLVRDSKFFSKMSRNHLKILGAKMIMKHKFHTENRSEKI